MAAIEHQTKRCAFCRKWYIKPCTEAQHATCNNFIYAKMLGMHAGGKNVPKEEQPTTSTHSLKLDDLKLPAATKAAIKAKAAAKDEAHTKHKLSAPKGKAKPKGRR